MAYLDWYLDLEECDRKRAYQLAWFLCPRREIGVAGILAGAVDIAHKSARMHERRVKKIALTKLQLLQIGILEAAGQEEKPTPPTPPSGLIWYIKHLALCTLPRSSFFAAVGFLRILSNGSVSQVLALHLFLDPCHYLGFRDERDVVQEIWVDWGDPTAPDPVGGTRLYPSEAIAARPGKVVLPLITHAYGPVPREGLRTTVRLRIVPGPLPGIRPETLTDDKLSPQYRLWVLPYGVFVQPPEAELRIMAPPAGEIVTPTTEVQIRAGAVTGDIHLLALDPTHPKVYQYLGKLPPPPFGQESTLTRVIDTSQLRAAGPFRLVALSSDQLTARVGDRVEWHDIPQAIPRDEVEVRHAGVILFPTPGAFVAGVGTVRTRIFLPNNTYAAVALVPTQEGSCWVQNDGRRVTPFAEFPLQVSYGGRDTYQVYVGVTQDPELFKAGDRRPQCPHVDPKGRPVYWIGPVEVAHE